MVVIMLLLLLVMLCSSAMALVHRYPFLQHRLTRPLRSPSTSHIAAATQQQDIPLPIIVPTRRSILDVNSTIEIAENRLIRAGDYVVHQDFGVGKFIGIKQVPVYLNKPTGPSLPAVVIKYRDGEVSIYQNFVTQMLWMFRAGNAGNFVLDSIIDVKAWSKRKQKATTRSQE